MYIARDIWTGDAAQKQRLLSLLLEKRCKDRFFVPDADEQPEGAVGLPAPLAQRQSIRISRLAEFELENQLTQRRHANSLRMREQEDAVELGRHRRTLEFRREEGE